MSQADETQVPETNSQPQAGGVETAAATDTPQRSDTPTPQAGGDWDEIIRKLRAENASHRKKAQEARQELERTLRVTRARETLLRAGINDPEPVVSALALDGIEPDKIPDVVTGVINILRESLKQSAPSMPPPSSPAAPPKAASLTMADIANMSEKEINQRWAEVQEAIMKGM